MSGPYGEKVRYYARLDVIDWVARVYPGLPCEVGGYGAQLERIAPP